MQSIPEILESLRSEWNVAEAEIKRAEQLNNAVVIPAINELRYAGRRLADVLALWGREEEQQNIVALCNDAKFFCHRARHDAIDASVSFMIENLKTMVETIGPSILMSCCPQVSTLRLSLIEVQKNIVISRTNREDRDKIYKTVSDCNFGELIELHATIAASEELMIKAAEQAAETQRKNDAYGRIGIMVGVGGLLFGTAMAMATWMYPDFWKRESKPDATAQSPAAIHSSLDAKQPLDPPATISPRGLQERDIRTLPAPTKSPPPS